jgi:hypothetical protein
MFCRSALLILFMLPGLALAQSPQRAGFPQIAVGGDPAGLHFVTVVQIVNNNSTPTTARFDLFSDAGTAFPVLFDGTGSAAAMEVTLQPGEARQVDMRRTTGLASGWMRVTYTPSPALTVVLLQYYLGTTLLSEVGVAPETVPLLSADFGVENGAGLNTGIAIGNPSSTAPTHVLAQLWNPANGTVAGQTVISLVPNGHRALFATELFAAIPNVGQMRAKISLDSCVEANCAVLGGNGFMATALRFHNDQFTTITVAPRTSVGEQVRIFPQVAFGGSPTGGFMRTLLYFTTNVPEGVSGTAEILDNNGNLIAASVNGAAPSSSFSITVPGNRVARVELSGDDVLRSGWIRLTLSSSVHLVTSAVFQTFNGATLLSEAGVTETTPTQRGLVYVKKFPGTDVGVAISNSDSVPTTVSLDIFDQQGNLVTRRDITLPANGHMAQFVTEIFPQLGAVSEFTGSMAVHSTGAFSPMALRLTGEKIASLPFSPDGMHRPTITGLRVSQVQASTGQVSFSVDITDVDADVATGTLPVFAVATVEFGAGGSDLGGVSMDGNPILNRTTGTLGGTLQLSAASVASGTTAVLKVQVYDSLANTSNTVSVPFTF